MNFTYTVSRSTLKYCSGYIYMQYVVCISMTTSRGERARMEWEERVDRVCVNHSHRNVSHRDFAGLTLAYSVLKYIENWIACATAAVTGACCCCSSRAPRKSVRLTLKFIWWHPSARLSDSSGCRANSIAGTMRTMKLPIRLPLFTMLDATRVQSYYRRNVH